MAGASDAPRADALALLEQALGRKREWIVAHGDAAASLDEARALRRLTSLRRAGMPVAYLRASAWFCGREFVVDERVLVPRPETEHLVEEAIAFIEARRPCVARVLDVGTGCGAIACTIAARTGAPVDGTDISGGALAVAVENARRLGVTERCRFHLGDLAQPVRGRRFDVIVANLPYVPTGDVPQPPNPVAFEPRVALDGGADGMELYRRLTPQLSGLLSGGALVLLEAAPPTIGTLASLAAASLPGFTISLGRDYAGLERYVRAELPAG